MSKRILTPKQSLLVKNLAKGMSITDAALKSGYSENSAAQCGSQALKAIRLKMPEILDKAGLTDEALVENYLKPLLNAENTEFAKFEGKITDERNVTAWEPRKAGLDMAFNLKGLYAAKDSTAGSSSITVNVLVMPDRET